MERRQWKEVGHVACMELTEGGGSWCVICVLPKSAPMVKRASNGMMAVSGVQSHWHCCVPAKHLDQIRCITVKLLSIIIY